LWTLHRKHLDAKGLVALWREALLAQKVLQGRTKGYTHHPQFFRSSQTTNPPAALSAYLAEVHAEAVRRGYSFDARKIGKRRFRRKISETRGRLLYEWRHLKRKLKQRDPRRYRASLKMRKPTPHPLFRMVAGNVREWERVRR
jgi:hypothetical protein